MDRLERIKLQRRIEKGERILRRTEALFAGLTGLTNVEIKKNGSTFAVAAQDGFSYFALMSCYFSYRSNEYIYEEYLTLIKSQKKTMLVLPNEHAIATLNPEAAEAAAVHESGHIRRDRIGKLSFTEAAQILNRLRETNSVVGSFNTPKLKRLMNLLADIRLERLDVKEWPRVASKYEELQEWVWELEAELRVDSNQPMIQSLIRDYGKNHLSQSRRRVLGEYNQETLDMFNDCKFIIDEFISAFESRPDDTTLTFEYALRLYQYIRKGEVEQDFDPFNQEQSNDDNQDPTETDSSDDSSRDQDKTDDSEQEQSMEESDEDDDDESQEGNKESDGVESDEDSQDENSKASDDLEDDDDSLDEEGSDDSRSSDDENEINEDSTDSEADIDLDSETDQESEIKEEPKRTKKSAYSPESWDDGLRVDALDPSSAMDLHNKDKTVWNGVANINYSEF